MNKQEHLLVILGEECAEVIHGVSKALRFGMDHDWPMRGATNKRVIEAELADLFETARQLGLKIHKQDMTRKRKRIRLYMAVSRRLGRIQ